jgi:hypothetical protein
MSAINTYTSPLVHRPQTAGTNRPPSPQLPTDQFQTAESHSRGPWGLAGTALVLLAGGAALTGCTEQAPIAPIQATTPMPLENPQLMVLPDGVPRIDLYRSTSTSYSTDLNGNQTSSESDDPYNSVGTYMGSGLFRDINNNLVFVPQLAFGQEVGVTHFDQAQLRAPSRWFASPSLTRNADGSVTAKGMPPDAFRSTPNSLQVMSGRNVSHEVVRTANGLELRDWNRAHFQIKQNGNGIEIYQYGQKTHTIQRQDDTIHVQKYDNRPNVITRDGATITVTETYWKPLTITQSEHGFHVEGGYNQPYNVTYGPHGVQSDNRMQNPLSF